MKSHEMRKKSLDFLEDLREELRLSIIELEKPVFPLEDQFNSLTLLINKIASFQKEKPYVLSFEEFHYFNVTMRSEIIEIRDLYRSSNFPNEYDFIQKTEALFKEMKHNCYLAIERFD